MSDYYNAYNDGKAKYIWEFGQSMLLSNDTLNIYENKKIGSSLFPVG